MGEGAHRFLEVTWEGALFNQQIMDGLRTLVVKEHRAAVVTKGTMELLVGESRKIE